MAYKITKETYKKNKNTTALWDAEAEALIGMLARRLVNIRPNLKFNKVCIELHDKYLKKTKTGITNSPTQMERTFKLG